MGNLFKGVHLLTQSEYNTLAANEQLDPDVLYATPENVTELVRLHTEQISQNTSDIITNRNNILSNTADIEQLKTSSSGPSSEIVDIKNTISEIIVRDTNQDNRLTNIEENFATKEYVVENGGKIDKITVNGVAQNIIDKTVNIVVPDISDIEAKLSKTVNLDETQTITGVKTFTEHIYLANADGTVDRISHLNNNFIIHSGATNSAVLNIDEGLGKIYAFNNELAFKSDIAEASGTTIYVDGTGVASLNFSSDPQTQINLLGEELSDNKTELTTNINAKVSKSGDTMTGELVTSDGIKFGNNKIKSENSGNTLRTYHIENNEEYDILNYTHGGMLTVNNAETPLILQGYDDRPIYVSGSGVMSDLALESDIPTKVSELTNDRDYDTTTNVDNKISSNLNTAKSYTDTKIADLIDSAPETRDTLAELAKAIQDNETVVDALNAAIGNKADKTELNNYLPLSAGSSKPLTGILYADKGIRIPSDNAMRFAGEAKFITPSKVIRFGSSDENDSDLMVMTQSYLRPNGNNTTLGNTSNQWKEIYGTTIYQNNKQVANKEDIPTNNNQLTNGAGYVTSSGSVASATKATQDSDGNAINTTYLKKSGGTVGSLTFDSVGKGLTFKTKDGVEYFIYGDGTNYSRIYIQLKDKDGNYQWYPLLDENGKLYSNKNEVANNNLSNVTYPEIVYNASTDKFDGLTHTGAGDRVIKSFVSSDGLAWYRVWASGWKECGAEINTQSKEIYFPDIEFSTTHYVVTGVGMNIAEIGMQSITKYKDKFVTASAVREIATFSYYACGY